MIDLYFQKIYYPCLKAIHKLKIFLFAFLPKNQKEKNKQNHVKKIALELQISSPLNINQTHKSTWENYRKKIRNLIITQDLRFFLNWNVIKSSMFHEPNICELKELQSSSNWNIWESAIKENKFGFPRPYSYFPKSSGNLIHNAYTLNYFCKFYDILNIIPKLENIFEFGGGYGSFCRLFLNLGFTGNYKIYDFPEFLLLQNYFLTSLPYFNQQNKSRKPKIIYTNEFQNSERNSNSKNFDIFLATWSFSESPTTVREKCLKYIGKPKYFIFAFQKQFEDIDNLLYFKNIMTNLPEYMWHLKEITHQKNNYYLFGKQKYE